MGPVNLIKASEIDEKCHILSTLKVPYNVTVLGTVAGIEIRRLEYKNKVILEQMQKQEDGDDVIYSHQFIKGTEPKDWMISI